MPVERALVAVAVWFIPATLVYWVVKADPRPPFRSLLLTSLCLVPLSAPFLLASPNALLRALVAIQSFLCLAKIVDYGVTRPRHDDQRGGFWSCILYITFWPSLDFSRSFLRVPQADRSKLVVVSAATAAAKFAVAAVLMALGATVALRE